QRYCDQPARAALRAHRRRGPPRLHARGPHLQRRSDPVVRTGRVQSARDSPRLLHGQPRRRPDHVARSRAAPDVILGIETSCDETAAALISDEGRIFANIVSSQADLHARYGGVVPEVASRRHLELVTPVVLEALGDFTLDDVERIAVTRGPGLIGALLVGLQAAKAIAWARRLPLVPVDHLHG